MLTGHEAGGLGTSRNLDMSASAVLQHSVKYAALETHGHHCMEEAAIAALDIQESMEGECSHGRS